jgi:hypothetical protein
MAAPAAERMIEVSSTLRTALGGEDWLPTSHNEKAPAMPGL